MTCPHTSATARPAALRPNPADSRAASGLSNTIGIAPTHHCDTVDGIGRIPATAVTTSRPP